MYRLNLLSFMSHSNRGQQFGGLGGGGGGNHSSVSSEGFCDGEVPPQPELEETDSQNGGESFVHFLLWVDWWCCVSLLSHLTAAIELAFTIPVCAVRVNESSNEAADWITRALGSAYLFFCTEPEFGLSFPYTLGKKSGVGDRRNHQSLDQCPWFPTGWADYFAIGF